MRDTKLSLSGVTPVASVLASAVWVTTVKNKTKIFQSIDYQDQVLGLWEWSLGGHSGKMRG